MSQTITSSLPKLRPVNHPHDDSVTALVMFVRECAQQVSVPQLVEELLNDQRRLSPAEWGRQHDYKLPLILSREVKAKSRVEKLYQHKIVSEIAAYARNPNPRKQPPSYPLSINLGAVDKQMCSLTKSGNRLFLQWKCWSEEFTLEFIIPDYVLKRNIRKWSLPKIIIENDTPYYYFSIQEECGVKYDETQVAGVDLGRVEPFVIGVVNSKGQRVADYHASGRLKKLNTRRENLLKLKKHLITKITAYENLGLNTDILIIEKQRVGGKAKRLGKTISNLTGFEVVRHLNKHPVKLIHVENLKWVTGSKYGSKWAHSQTQASITHSANREGFIVKRINPKNTSQSCHVCGGKITHNTRKRLVYCSTCKTRKDRDVNAALNIAKKNRYPSTIKRITGVNSRGLELQVNALSIAVNQGATLQELQPI